MDKVYLDENNNSEKIIRGKALYYSTSQVATILNQPDSKIRYYTNEFNDILHIEISNKQRRYTESDIDKLRFLIELKQEGMTIKQIQEYCQQVDFQNSKEIRVKENNPLSLQSISKALFEQQEYLMLEMQNKIIKQQQEMIENLQMMIIQNNESMKEQLSITIDDVVSEKLNEFKEEFTKEIVESNRLAQQSNDLLIKLEQRKKEHEEEQSKPKSFLDKIFRKNK